MKDSSKRSRNRSPEKGAVKTTIVGGRPLVAGRRQGSIPRGIEVLVKKASVDPAFRKLLLEKRAEAAHEIDLELTPAEVAALNAVPPTQMEKIIENTRVPDVQRRAFLGQVGAAMMAALTLGLSACETPSETLSETPSEAPSETPTPWVVEKGITKALPTPIKKPTPTPTLVRSESERLDVKVEGEGADTATVVVSYDCAFETGEITIDFRQNPDVQGGDIAYQPAQSVAVSRGSGEVTFHASGTGGTTNWLIVRLRSTAEQCQGAPTSWPQHHYEPGEYVEDCVVWSIAWYHKEWPSKE